MPRLTIAAAARLCHCDRRTLQRAIHAGRLHLDAQHSLSRDELLATGYLVPDTPQETPHITPHGTPQETPLLAGLERLAAVIMALQEELRALRADLRQRTHPAPQSTPRPPPLPTPQPTPQATPQGGSAYDSTRYILGRLCPRGHEYEGTGLTLRKRHSRTCVRCEREQRRERRARQGSGG